MDPRGRHLRHFPFTSMDLERICQEINRLNPAVELCKIKVEKVKSSCSNCKLILSAQSRFIQRNDATAVTEPASKSNELRFNLNLDVHHQDRTQTE